MPIFKYSGRRRLSPKSGESDLTLVIKVARLHLPCRQHTKASEFGNFTRSSSCPGKGQIVRFRMMAPWRNHPLLSPLFHGRVLSSGKRPHIVVHSGADGLQGAAAPQIPKVQANHKPADTSVDACGQAIISLEMLFLIPGNATEQRLGVGCRIGIQYG